MEHRIVLRLKGLFPNELGRYRMHARRAGGDLSHVDETKSALNAVVLGPQDWAERLRAQIAEAAATNLAEEVAARRARKRPGEARAVAARGPVDPWKFTRTGPLREGILTAAKAWFGGSGADEWDPEKVAAFRDRGLAFLAECFGETCVHARIDCDEEALHFHFVLAPWHEKRSASRGRQRLLQPSSHPLIRDYEQAQDVVAEYFADLGLARGQCHAAARRAAKALGEALPPRPRHVPPAVWRARQQQSLVEAMAEVSAREAAVDEERGKAEALVRALRAVEAGELVYVPGATKREDQLGRGPAYPADTAKRLTLKDAVQRGGAEFHRHLRALAEAARAVTAGERARLEADKQALAEARRHLEAREASGSQSRERVTRAARQVAADMRRIAAVAEDKGLSAIPELAGILARYDKPLLAAPAPRPAH
jgi:hypothetical protein